MLKKIVNEFKNIWWSFFGYPDLERAVARGVRLLFNGCGYTFVAINCNDDGRYELYGGVDEWCDGYDYLLYVRAYDLFHDALSAIVGHGIGEEVERETIERCMKVFTREDSFMAGDGRLFCLDGYVFMRAEEFLFGVTLFVDKQQEL